MIDDSILRNVAYVIALKNAVDNNGTCRKDVVRNKCIGYLRNNGYEINKELLEKLERIL